MKAKYKVTFLGTSHSQNFEDKTPEKGFYTNSTSILNILKCAFLREFTIFI